MTVADDLSFEAWARRPVYVAQCKTWRLANEMGVCTPHFRVLPPYRNELDLQARRLVANAIRQARTRQRASSA